MSRVDVVRAAMVEAMKAKDKARKDSLSMLLSALKNAEIDKRSPLTEEEADAVVKKEIKQTKETLELAPADRADIREEAQARLAAGSEYPGQCGLCDDLRRDPCDDAGERRKSGAGREQYAGSQCIWKTLRQRRRRNSGGIRMSERVW